MKRAGWIIVGIALLVTVGFSFAIVPAVATSVQSLTTSATAMPLTGNPQPVWQTGNLCVPNPDPYQWNCHSLASDQDLWYNESAYENTGITYIFVIMGSNDCININFHGFDSTVIIKLFGSHYHCASATGAGGPDWYGKSGQTSLGVNVVINGDYDCVRVYEDGSFYASNFYVIGTQTGISFKLFGSHLSPTTYFIGIENGGSVCPSGITYGRTGIARAASFGSFNTLSTVWITGSDSAHPPTPFSYYTVSWTGAMGYHDRLGFELETLGSFYPCVYLYV